MVPPSLAIERDAHFRPNWFSELYITSAAILDKYRVSVDKCERKMDDFTLYYEIIPKLPLVTLIMTLISSNFLLCCGQRNFSTVTVVFYDSHVPPIKPMDVVICVKINRCNYAECGIISFAIFRSNFQHIVALSVTDPNFVPLGLLLSYTFQ